MIPKKAKKVKVLVVVAPKGFILVTDCDMGTICAIRVSLISQVADWKTIDGDEVTRIRFIDRKDRDLDVFERINVVLDRMAKAGAV